MKNVAVLLFDEAEELDFAGPLEVFAAASELHEETPFEIYTVAEHTGAIRAHNGLRVLPDYSFSTCPAPDILVICRCTLSRNSWANGMPSGLHATSGIPGWEMMYTRQPSCRNRVVASFA